MVNPLRLRCNHIFCDACISEWCERFSWPPPGFLSAYGGKSGCRDAVLDSRLAALPRAPLHVLPKPPNCALEAADVEAAAGAAHQAPESVDERPGSMQADAGADLPDVPCHHQAPGRAPVRRRGHLAVPAAVLASVGRQECEGPVFAGRLPSQPCQRQRVLGRHAQEQFCSYLKVGSLCTACRSELYL
jgi:hypothetical protein